MAETSHLSDAALELLRSYRGDIRVTDSNREACRELAREGLLIVGHDFTRGREAFYRMTERGVRMLSALAPSPSVSASRLR